MIPGQATAQLKPQSQTISSITADQLVSILKDGGFKVQIEENGEIVASTDILDNFYV